VDGAAFVLNEKHFFYILLFSDGKLGRGDYHFLRLVDELFFSSSSFPLIG